jgi:hypothetical protein
MARTTRNISPPTPNSAGANRAPVDAAVDVRGTALATRRPLKRTEAPRESAAPRMIRREKRPGRRADARRPVPG